MSVERAFVEQSRNYLQREYLAKIKDCVTSLDDVDVWWRPNEQSNSIGNLVLHLAGNVRQWVVSGIGGAADTRRRQEEFDARNPLPTTVLIDTLETAVREADAVLAGLAPAALHEKRTIQGRELNVLDAVYHVVEHFSMHTGQIAYITKLRTGRDLEFYTRDADGLALPRWTGARPVDPPGGDAGRA